MSKPLMSNALRKIAEHELEACLPGLNPLTRDELATSVVRQWIGNDGNAVILTPEFNFWFCIKKVEDGGTQVVRDRQPQTFVDHMRGSRVIEEEIPGLLHELNVRQSVQCVTDYGQKVRLRVDPGKRGFFVELVLDDDVWHRYPNA
jgi:hypothetical protein